jgi:hypothetical protein
LQPASRDSQREKADLYLDGEFHDRARTKFS